MKKKVIVLSGAGISAESGLKTFRGDDGLWEGHRVQDVATPRAWRLNPELVLEFYNQRRADLIKAEPNIGHEVLVALGEKYEVSIVTQNVDDLHERAGSENVLHLHGELLKSQSTDDKSKIYPCRNNIEMGDTCEFGSQLRPFIVWFGEAVPLLDRAIAEMVDANIVIIVGTSLQVYPAAGLVSFVPKHCKIYYVDPEPADTKSLDIDIEVTTLVGSATKQLPLLVDTLLQEA